MLGHWNLNVMVHIFHLRHLRGRDRGTRLCPTQAAQKCKKADWFQTSTCFCCFIGTGTCLQCSRNYEKAKVKNACKMMPISWPVLDHRNVHNFIDILHLWHMNLSGQETEYSLVGRSAHQIAQEISAD